MKPARPRTTLYFELVPGRFPAKEDLNALRDDVTKHRLQQRIDRASQGNYGVSRRLDADLIELVVDFGPGHRIYLGEDGQILIVILVVGDKKSQASDIVEARGYWAEYKRRKEGGKHHAT